MAQVTLGENENVESALRRFRRKVSRANIFADFKKNQYFETPTEKSKRKAIALRRHRKGKRRY